MPDESLQTNPRNVRIARTLVELVTASNRLTRYAARTAGETESPAVWRTLSALLTSGPMRIGELAVESRVAQPTMTKIVRGLVERTWVLRIADSEDARAWQIAVTPQGAAALESWRSRMGEVMLPVFVDLSDDEVETLAAAVTLVQSRLTSQLTHQPA